MIGRDVIVMLTISEGIKLHTRVGNGNLYITTTHYDVGTHKNTPKLVVAVLRSIYAKTETIIRG